MSDITKTTRQHMQEAVEFLSREFHRLRTGRASPALLDHIHVEYYGTSTPLNQIASVSVPEARLLVISPYDQTSLKDIEKAILASDLGLTPSNDGRIIRLTLPELTGERRKELVKEARHKAEDARVSVRNSRRAANDAFKKAQKDHDLTEDEMHKRQDQIQKMTDDFIKKIDDLLAKKEAEITEV